LSAFYNAARRNYSDRIHSPRLSWLEHNNFSQGKCMKKSVAILVLTVGLWCETSYADALRCGTHVVEVGSHKSDVLARCGQPLSSDKRSQCKPELLQTGATVQNCEEIEEWTYKKGQGQFMTLVELRANRVTAISQTGR